MRKIIASLAVCSVLVSNIYAAPVTFVFDGVVNNVEPQLTGTFSVGDAYRVQFTFESTTPDVTLDIRFGHYNSAITALSVTVGSYSATATGGDIAVTNDFAFDTYRIDVRNNSMAGPPVNGYSLFGNQNPVMVMTDFTASAFSSVAAGCHAAAG